MPDGSSYPTATDCMTGCIAARRACPNEFERPPSIQFGIRVEADGMPGTPKLAVGLGRPRPWQRVITSAKHVPTPFGVDQP